MTHPFLRKNIQLLYRHTTTIQTHSYYTDTQLLYKHTSTIQTHNYYTDTPTIQTPSYYADTQLLSTIYQGQERHVGQERHRGLDVHQTTIRVYNRLHIYTA